MSLPQHEILIDNSGFIPHFLLRINGAAPCSPSKRRAFGTPVGRW